MQTWYPQGGIHALRRRCSDAAPGALLWGAGLAASVSRKVMLPLASHGDAGGEDQLARLAGSHGIHDGFMGGRWAAKSGGSVTSGVLLPPKVIIR